jgi:hypothetical protein
MLAFLGCCAYCIYCWVVVVRNREAGYRWWEFIPISGETLNQRGRHYLKRWYFAMLLGVGIVAVALLVYRQK